MTSTKQDKKTALLALSTGTVEKGEAHGVPGTTGSELSFNTSMTGCHEIFIDPSYHVQIMLMTYPRIVNYGSSNLGDEADRVMVSGIVVRSFSTDFSNSKADSSLQDYLARNKITAIAGVDTRKLVRHTRKKGMLNAVISTEITDEKELIERASNWLSRVGLEVATGWG